MLYVQVCVCVCVCVFVQNIYMRRCLKEWGEKYLHKGIPKSVGGLWVKKFKQKAKIQNSHLI